MRTKEVVANLKTAEEVAKETLARQLRTEISQGIHVVTNDLYQDLLFDIVPDVNGKELAEDLLAN